MPQLLEFRKLFVEATGHWELVTDYNGGDYTDNGADKYIRGGQKILDRWLPGVSGQRVSTRVLEAGENHITVAGLRFVDTVHYKDPDTGEWCRLTRKTPSEMFTFAPKRSAENAGSPQYWMRDYRQSVATQGLRNGSFSEGLTSWTTQAGSPSVAGGVLTLGSTGVDKSDLSVDWKVGLPDVSIVSGNAHMKAITGDASTMFKDTNVSSSPFSLNISTLPANSTVTVYTLLNFNIVDTNVYTTSGTKTINPSGNYDRITVQFSTSEVTEQTAIINDISLFSQVVDVLYQRLNGRSDASDDLSIVIDTITAGATLTVRVGTWNSAYANITTVTSATYNTNGTKTLTPTGAWDVISIAISAPDAATAGISSITLTGSAASEAPEVDTPTLVFDRPADVNYTIEVRGGNYAANLLFDNDESFWSTEEVDLLLEAAILELESIYHRNTTGVQDRLATLRMKVQSLYYDMCQHEQGGTPEDMRLGV